MPRLFFARIQRGKSFIHTTVYLPNHPNRSLELFLSYYQEVSMANNDKPAFYKGVSEQFPEVIKAVEQLGETLRTAGPLDLKTSHLVQLAAAAASQSEGAVSSHTRRATFKPERVRRKSPTPCCSW